MKKQIMVDIETLGLDVDAVVTEIGACVFDLGGVVESGAMPNTFHKFLGWVDQVMEGRTFDCGTVAFRVEDTSGAFLKSSSGSAYAPGVGCLKFTEWVRSQQTINEIEYIWCNGTDFDAAILKHLFKGNCVKEPWRYNQFRDLRTLRTVAELLGIKAEKRKNDHNALNDAMNQAAEAAEILAAIERMKG